MAKAKYEEEIKRFSSLIDVFSNRFLLEDVNNNKSDDKDETELKGK